MKRRSPSHPGGRLRGLRTLIGNDVYNLDTDELGNIVDIVVDMGTGRIGFAVLRCHVMPSLGARLVAVPWRRLTLNTRLRCFVLDLSVDRLAGAPAFDANHWPDMADTQWQLAVHRYHGGRSPKPMSGNAPTRP